jgi:hypothetical protein
MQKSGGGGAGESDQPVEETLGQGRHQVQHGGHGPGTLAQQGHILGVPAKLCNVLLDPGEGEELVV